MEQKRQECLCSGCHEDRELVEDGASYWCKYHNQCQYVDCRGKKRAGKSPWCKDHKEKAEAAKKCRSDSWKKIKKAQEKLEMLTQGQIPYVIDETRRLYGGKNEIDDEVCGICLENLVVPSDTEMKNVVLEECSHEFHQDCITQWYDISKKGRGRNCKAECPSCRRGFRMSEVQCDPSEVLMLNEARDKAYVVYQGWPAEEGD